MLQLIRTTLLVLLLAGLPVGVSMAQTPATAGKDSLTEAAIAAGHRVMEEFMTAFNARDVEAWSQTLLFPHVRVASGDVTVSADRDAFVAAMDFTMFAERFDWSHSSWDHIEVIQAGPEKVHFKVQFSRYNRAGERNATFDSLYVVQKVDNEWGIRLRSSFAP